MPEFYSGSNPFERRTEPERGFKVQVQRIPEPNAAFEFGVRGKRARTRTEPNLASTTPPTRLGGGGWCIETVRGVPRCTARCQIAAAAGGTGLMLPPAPGAGPALRRPRAWVAVGQGYRASVDSSHLQPPGALFSQSRSAVGFDTAPWDPARIVECAIPHSPGREGAQGYKARACKVLINKSTSLIDIDVDDDALIAEATGSQGL
ncbi:hypothetical protein B0H16DRAFT_1703284 [Mycena metata]|uniref:Uncharacterized protein n=1 Tax=Mycena metata TaxID=1033252 RepID=A0AAD7H455_9AGAR|nr:hypothetical protein B0H16DRAFT_1703284 [Mycena metata]